MASNYRCRYAAIKDTDAIKELLRAAALPVVQSEDQVSEFILADEKNEVIGILGVLYDGNQALLRSFAVKMEKRNQGAGKMLLQKMLQIVADRRCKNIFLLTETAAAYFKKAGFEEINREQIPLGLLCKSGLDQGCSCNSRCFSYRL